MRVSRTLVPMALAAGVAALAGGSGAAGAGQIVPRDMLAATAVLGEMPLVQGRQVRLAVELRIEPGYHVNANPPSEDWLIPVEVRVEGADGVSIDGVFYPEAQERRFSFYPEALRVYEGSVVAGVLLDIADGAAAGDHDLLVKVRYQACDDEACFAPTEATARVPARVAPAGTPWREVDLPLLRRARFVDPER